MRYYSILVSLLLSLLSPMQAVAAGTVLVDSKGPVEQDFVLTAYYSPLPDQCCYIKGSYEADKILNGEGTNGADGTPVYAGMLAAPPSYAFGTRIELPGLGILTVHDRGGAIQEWDHAHRLDVWAGAGEEGLARALAFGVQHIRGKVYAPGTPMPSESVSLADLPAPLKRLEPYTVSDAGVASTNAVVPAKKAVLPIDTLQERLAILGYFQHPVTGIYGDITRTAVATFINDIGIQDTVETVTEKTSAYIDAAVRVQEAPSPIVFVGKESIPIDIMKMQRMLRYLGYYRGRTDGVYSERLFTAIFEYQKSVGLVSAETSPGAGRIGPLTKEKLDREVKRRRIVREATRLLNMYVIRGKLTTNGTLLHSTLSMGASGPAVRTLQLTLADGGFFPRELINGNFGERTKQAVADFQVAHSILGTTTEKGSGSVGPVTLEYLQQEQIKQALTLVRGQGWIVLGGSGQTVSL